MDVAGDVVDTGWVSTSTFSTHANTFPEGKGGSSSLGEQRFVRGCESGVKVSSPLEHQPHDEQPPICLGGHCRFDCGTHPLAHIGETPGVLDRNLHPGPAHDVEGDELDGGDFVGTNGHEASPLGAGLPDVTPLQVPGEDHVRSLVQNVALMHVAEGPVVVALRGKLRERTRRIARMAGHALERGM